MHILISSLPCPKTSLVHGSLDLPVPILILHCSEMALDSQQHLHVSCHRVVKQGIGMPLGELQSLLQKEVICKAMTKITTEFPILAPQSGMLEVKTISTNAPFSASGLYSLEKAQLDTGSLEHTEAGLKNLSTVARGKEV